MTQQCVNCPGAEDHSTAQCPLVSEQSKIDAERTAFESAVIRLQSEWPFNGIGLNKREDGSYVDPAEQSGWLAWQARASLPAAGSSDLTAVRCQCCATEYPHDSYDAGFIAGSGMCQVCDAAMPPKDLPDAGSAVEEVEVVAYQSIDATRGGGYMAHKHQLPQSHIDDGALQEPLMTVAQHNRIVATLSAQQSAPERVSVPTRQTLNNLARDGELIASGWNACLDEFSKLNPSIEQVSSLLEWAVSRWEAEVSLRPLHNVHRRPLDDTWRQVIRRIGGDDKALCGPAHDELLASHGRGEA